MVGLLSLPDELIELVGQQAMCDQEDGLRKWCQLTSTCKRLWDMQLPGSASEWCIDLNAGIEGQSKVSLVSLEQ